MQADGLLLSTFPLHPTGSSCALNGSTYQVQVLVLSDDSSVVAAFEQLRPCWRFVTAFAHEPALVRVVDQSQDSLPSTLKRKSAERLMTEPILATEAEYAVVTYSSNIGRLVALSRGWVDSHWEKRVISLDVPWYSWGS